MHCADLVKDVLERNAMTIDGLEVSYALEHRARSHRAYRSDMQMDDLSLNSPFSRHSARVTELWSLESEPRDRWREICDSYAPRRLAGHLRGLAFPIDRLSDRVGNLVTSGAEDEIACDLVSRHSQLILDVSAADGSDLPPSAYYATVWAHDSGDVLLQRHLEIAERHTVVDVDSRLDQIGFAVFRRGDGQCIDRRESTLVREIHGVVNASSGQTRRIHDATRNTTNTVSLGDATSTIGVGDDHRGDLDHAMRREVLTVAEVGSETKTHVPKETWGDLVQSRRSRQSTSSSISSPTSGARTAQFTSPTGISCDAIPTIPTSGFTAACSIGQGGGN